MKLNICTVDEKEARDSEHALTSCHGWLICSTSFRTNLAASQIGIASGMGSALSCEVVTRCLFDGSGSVFSEDSPSEGTPCFTLSVTRPEVAKDVRYLSRDLTIEYERAGNRQLVPQLWNKDGVCLCGSCDEHRRTGLPGTRCDFLFETDVKEVQFAIQGPQYLASGELQMNSARKPSRNGPEPGSCRMLQVAECGTLASAEHILAAFVRKPRVHLRRTLPYAFIMADSNSDTGSVASRSRSFRTLCRVDSTKCSLPDVDVC